ncbi:MAG: hypothetical protein N3G20_06575, partial [Verrucomicrobiae bacterium]|nr:hypothetical protein [Verrucomicrobiae bacterium]
QTVQAHLSDPRPVVRQAAVRTLSDWPDVSAWELLSNLYKETQTGPERVLVLRGLVRLLSEENHKPDREIVDRYRMLLATAATDSDRKLVMGALAGCAHPDALKLAVEQLDHPGVRAEASATLKKIAEAIKTTHPREAQQALQLLRPDH